MRIADVSFLTGYSEYQIRKRARHLAEFGTRICVRVKAATRFDDFILHAPTILRECKDLERDTGLSSKLAAEEVARRWTNERNRLSIPPHHAADMGGIRLIIWACMFEGWRPVHRQDVSRWQPGEAAQRC